MYVCTYVCVYVHTYVCMFVYMYVSMYACIYVRMYVCMYVVMYAFIYLFIGCLYDNVVVRANLGRLVVGVSPWRPRFDARLVSVGLAVVM